MRIFDMRTPGDLFHDIGDVLFVPNDNMMVAPHIFLPMMATPNNVKHKIIIKVKTSM